MQSSYAGYTCDVHVSAVCDPAILSVQPLICPSQSQNVKKVN